MEIIGTKKKESTHIPSTAPVRPRSYAGTGPGAMLPAPPRPLECIYGCTPVVLESLRDGDGDASGNPGPRERQRLILPRPPWPVECTTLRSRSAWNFSISRSAVLRTSLSSAGSREGDRKLPAPAGEARVVRGGEGDDGGLAEEKSFRRTGGRARWKCRMLLRPQRPEEVCVRVAGTRGGATAREKSQSKIQPKGFTVGRRRPNLAKLRFAQQFFNIKPPRVPTSRAKLKSTPASTKSNTPTAGALPDVLWTSILALKESADAFPPQKSTVGGVIALLELAERARHSKSNARAIALRTKEILDVIADAVPDASVIPSAMLESIERFTVLLDEIRCRMEKIALTGGVSRVVHLNRNEHVLQDIKAQLDDAYRDFLAASALRLEVAQAHIGVQQTQLATQQAQTHLDLGKISTISYVVHITRHIL
ncbi:hypothetical protein C8R44DRAFT_752206 [Mycena epipterygia]|nr:hypothetical protein C8R44DRAFT_752206 [Mycena epipterygia]